MEAVKYRSICVDIAKGIGIFLVVLGHTTENEDLRQWIYSFHMPLFFLISGIFFDTSIKGLLKKVVRLTIPYFAFALLSFAYWRLLEIHFRELPEGFDANTHFVDIFFQRNEFYFNVVLWFLPCLILVTIATSIITQITNNRLVVFILYALCLGCTCFYSPMFDCMWMNEAFYALPFFMIGYSLKNVFVEMERQLIRTNVFIKLLFVAPFCLLPLFQHPNDMMSSNYSCGYMYFHVIAVILIISLLGLSSLLISQKWLVSLGVNSLTIMCLHEPLKRIVVKIISIVLGQSVDVVRNSYLMSIFITILIVVSLYPVCLLINRHCKWIIGRF